MGDGYCNNLCEIEERIKKLQGDLNAHKTQPSRAHTWLERLDKRLCAQDAVIRELIATIAKVGKHVDAINAPKPSRSARFWAWVQDHTYGLFAR